jgi:hypothetical protein
MQGLIQLKPQLALGWYFDRLASGQNFCASASRSTACGTDSGSFAATRNGSDQRSEHGSSSHHLCCPFVCPESFRPLLFNIGGADGVTPASNLY